MAGKLKIGNALLCEYAANGDRNKHTLVNVFSGNIVVDSFPAHMPFGLYCELTPDDPAPLDVTILFKLDNEKAAEAKISILEYTPGTPLPVTIPAFGIVADKPRTLTVQAKVEGFRAVKILSKEIYAGDVSRDQK